MNKPTLYMFSISPACQRVFAALAHKGVEYDGVDINIAEAKRPEEFEKVSPFGKVPVLVHEGHVILESANIIQYIDEVWPEPALMPTTPVERAHARRWIQYADRELFDRDAQFVHIERDADRKRALCADLFRALEHLELELEGNNAFFLGDKLSIVDCMLAPTMANLPVWAKITDNKAYAGYKNIIAYTERLKANPVLAETVFSVPADVYEEFFTAVLVHGMTFPPEEE